MPRCDRLSHTRDTIGQKWKNMLTPTFIGQVVDDVTWTIFHNLIQHESTSESIGGTPSSILPKEPEIYHE